jgi:NAD(P)-dependent dehydrogenase (short-subunit alcohol dehydrogenase family)
MRLGGKTALATGGASGFGAGIARKFRDEGARVMIADPNGEACEAMADMLGAPCVVADLGEGAPKARARFLATIPLGRSSTPQDLGNAACLLCSDEAAMLTGVALEVDGGRCI